MEREKVRRPYLVDEAGAKVGLSKIRVAGIR